MLLVNRNEINFILTLYPVILQNSLINFNNLYAHYSGFSISTIILSVDSDSLLLLTKPYDFSFWLYLIV